MTAPTTRGRRRRSVERRQADHHDLAAEIRQDIEAANAYMVKHGSFADMVRRYYRTKPVD